MAEERSESFARTILSSASEHFKWPENVLLYHLPPERELVTDTATRLCFQTYLHQLQLSFANRVALNANDMSPDGSAPFLVLQLGNQPFILSNFEGFVDFQNNKKCGLESELGPVEKMDEELYLSLIRVKLQPALDYQLWANQQNIPDTLHKSGLGLSWPLDVVIPRLSQLRYVWDYWSSYVRPLTDVLVDFEQACSVLSQRLGSMESFFPPKLTTLDVMVYAYLQAVLINDLPSRELRKIVLQFENLALFCNSLSQKQLT